MVKSRNIIISSIFNTIQFNSIPCNFHFFYCDLFQFQSPVIKSPMLMLLIQISYSFSSFASSFSSFPSSFASFCPSSFASICPSSFPSFCPSFFATIYFSIFTPALLSFSCITCISFRIPFTTIQPSDPNFLCFRRFLLFHNPSPQH